MKQLLVVVVMILVAASFVMGQTLGMASSKHNLALSSGTGIVGASEKVCGYCHTPHVPATGIKAPLWSRAKLASGTYGVYNNTISATMNASPTALAAGQDNVSSMCMSCHDGSALFASAAYVKRPDASGSWDETETVGDDANLHGGTTYGTGLSHTHPVNFVYDAALVSADGGLQTAPLNNLPLYNTMMQCGSCHNPHSTSDKMTRVTTDGGQLCISCHNK